MEENVSNLELYDTLKSPLGESAARQLVNFVVENGFHHKADLFATKTDIAVLRDEIAQLRYSTKEDIGELRRELEVKMAQMETRIIRWMFIFWIGQIATVIAIMKLL